MKRLILFLGAFLCTYNLFANTMNPTGWVWINDDGALSSGTFASDELNEYILNWELPIEHSLPILRLRYRLDNATSSDLTTTGLMFMPMDSINYLDQYLSGSSSLLTAVGTNAAFDWTTSVYVANGDSIEEEYLTFNGGSEQALAQTWAPGKFMYSSMQTTVKAGTHTELEYCLTPTELCKSNEYIFIPGGEQVVDRQFPTSSSWRPAILIVTVSMGLKKSESNNLQITNQENGLQISGLLAGTMVQVYDAFGKLTCTTVSKSNIVVLDGMSKGVYLVKINGKTSKAVVR